MITQHLPDPEKIARSLIDHLGIYTASDVAHQIEKAETMIPDNGYNEVEPN